MGGDAAKQRKAAQLANDIAAAEAALDAAQREYERVRQRNLQVCAGRWSLRLSVDLSALVAGPSMQSTQDSTPPFPPPARPPLQELERVRGERASEFGRLVRGCAGVSAEYQARCADIWGGVADDYGAGAALAAQRGVARGTP